MPTIDVDQSTYEKLKLAAELTDCRTGDVVRRLVERAQRVPSGSAAEAAPKFQPDHGSDRQTTPVPATVPTVTVIREAGASDTTTERWTPVFARYRGRRIEGKFDKWTMELIVTSAPWSGTSFSSPTAAAVDVVHRIAPEREFPNTNGRLFWRLATNGNPLGSLVGANR